MSNKNYPGNESFTITLKATLVCSIYDSAKRILSQPTNPGGALPYKPTRDVPFFRVSFFSVNS